MSSLMKNISHDATRWFAASPLVNVGGTVLGVGAVAFLTTTSILAGVVASSLAAVAIRHLLTTSRRSGYGFADAEREIAAERQTLQRREQERFEVQSIHSALLYGLQFLSLSDVVTVHGCQRTPLGWLAVLDLGVLGVDDFPVDRVVKRIQAQIPGAVKRGELRESDLSDGTHLLLLYRSDPLAGNNKVAF